VHTWLPGTPLGAGTHGMAQAVRLPGWPLEETMPTVRYSACAGLPSWLLKVTTPAIENVRARFPGWLDKTAV
jgi:hypothetical protein